MFGYIGLWVGAITSFFVSLLTNTDGFLFIYGSIAMWAILSLHIKRLHDRNKSGWYWLLYFGPFITIFAIFDEFHAVSLLLALWGFIEIHFLPGTQGLNRYGSPQL